MGEESTQRLTTEEMIRAACKRHEIDHTIPLAIAKLETGNFTSDAYKRFNNVGGLSTEETPIRYDSLESGVDAFVGNLAQNYFNQGLTTVEQISRKYCPVNAESWAEVVNALLEE